MRRFRRRRHDKLPAQIPYPTWTRRRSRRPPPWSRRLHPRRSSASWMQAMASAEIQLSPCSLDPGCRPCSRPCATLSPSAVVPVILFLFHRRPCFLSWLPFALSFFLSLSLSPYALSLSLSLFLSLSLSLCSLFLSSSLYSSLPPTLSPSPGRPLFHPPLPPLFKTIAVWIDR